MVEHFQTVRSQRTKDLSFEERDVWTTFQEKVEEQVHHELRESENPSSPIAECMQ